MRISDSMKYRQVISNLQTGQRALHDVQGQTSSGKRIQKPSEDPNAAAVIMQTRAQLRGIEQYQRNIGMGISRVETEEVVLNQLGDSIARALELAVGQADDTANAETRQQVKYEVDNLLAFVVTLGNTRFGEGFLFGGHRPDAAPFDPADPLGARTPAELAALDQPHPVEIAPGQRVPSNHNGKEIFLDTRVVEAISAFATALGSNDAAAIRVSQDELRGASQNVISLLGDVGGRYNHLQVTRSSLGLMNHSTTLLRSELEDVDLAKAMVELSARQSSMQAAMLSTSRILGLSLTDYIR